MSLSEKICACFCPVCYVCSKWGTGKECGIALVLTLCLWLPASCYACSLVGKEKEIDPFDEAAAEAAAEDEQQQQAITNQPKFNPAKQTD